MAQIAKEGNDGSDRNVPEYTVHHSLLCMGLQTSQGAMEQRKNLVWSDESRFLLNHMDGRVHVHHLHGELWEESKLTGAV